MYENVTVCITPKGEKPVLHFSQFDNENVFTVTVLADDGESAAVLTGLDIEFRIRKTDSHVVTIAPESVADNVITFKTTEQMCACCGQNIATVTLMKDDMVISTLDILVDIQRDILSGGLTSESDIRNLTTQIEQIVPEVVGDDYYTKTEVDDLIDSIPTFDPTNYYDKNYINTMYWTAQQCDIHFYRKTYINSNYYTNTEVDNLIDSIPTFDPTNYYDKSDVDGLLADKADADDVYTKTETDNLLADKADNSDIPDSINDLSDVNTAGAVNGNTLIYNNGTWVPGSGGGGVPTIYNLTPNVNINSTWGYYYEVGDTVFCTFRFSSTSNLSVSDALYTGLPRPDGNANLRFACIKYDSSATLTFIKVSGGSGDVFFESAWASSDIKYCNCSFFYKKA